MKIVSVKNLSHKYFPLLINLTYRLSSIVYRPSSIVYRLCFSTCPLLYELASVKNSSLSLLRSVIPNMTVLLLLHNNYTVPKQIRITDNWYCTLIYFNDCEKLNTKNRFDFIRSNGKSSLSSVWQENSHKNNQINYLERGRFIERRKQDFFISQWTNRHCGLNRGARGANQI